MGSVVLSFGRMLCGPLLHFRLRCREILHADDRLVGTLCMVFGKLAIIGQAPFCQVVFPECCLQQQVSGIGVVQENAGHAPLVPLVSVPGDDPIRI